MVGWVHQASEDNDDVEVVPGGWVAQLAALFQQKSGGVGGGVGDILSYETSGRYSLTEILKLRRSTTPRVPAPFQTHRGTIAQALLTPSPFRVSVICPTTDERTRFHEQLATCFASQQWSDKELVIVETYRNKPSRFLAELARLNDNVVLVSMQGDLSIGLKRNLGVHLSSGDVIVNFDDDDIYAPEYVSTMAGHLKANNLVALTLSTWFDFEMRIGKCGFVDPTNLQEEDAEEEVYGYGFSYVHLREPALAHPYPNEYFGEDFPFMQGLRDVYGHNRVGLLRDTRGICMHMIHGGNTADSVVHRQVAPQEMRGLFVSQMPIAIPLVNMCQQMSDGADGSTGTFTIRRKGKVCC